MDIKKIISISAPLLVFVFFSFSPVHADDVLTTIEEAVNQYKKGDLAGAASNLDYASQLVRQKKSEVMKDLLPEPLAGWKAEEATAQSIGTAVFGGGITVSRQYTAKQSKVSIDIMSDSPVLQSLVMMINNPMVAGASGGKLETLNGQRAIIQYDESTRNGDVNIVVANKFMVTVKGQKVDRSDLLSYAKSVDYETLSKN